MRTFFKRSTPMRDVVLFILCFGMWAPTTFVVANECNEEWRAGGCSAAGTVTGQGGCRTSHRRECEEDPESLVVRCRTITTCETITGACGDFGPLEL